MAQLQVKIDNSMRARVRPDAPLRERVQIEAARGWRDRGLEAFKLFTTSTLFVGGFVGGFILVCYAVQLPGFPRIP